MTLPSGRLAVAYHEGAGAAGALLSDDQGVTWRKSAVPTDLGGEGEVAIAPNGSLVAAMRDAGVPGGAGSYRRLLSWSHDGGETWTFPLDGLMPELGGSCEGALLRLRGGSSQWLLTSSPWGVGPDWDHRCPGPGRCNMTVWASADSGDNS